MMRNLLVAVLLLTGCYAHAQEAVSPEALQAANELVAVISGDTINQISRQMTAAVWPGIENSLKAKVDSETLGEIRSEFERQVAQFIGDGMKDAPAIYAKYFSLAELRDLGAFYKSPLGIKALQLMPKVMGESMALIGPRVPAFQAQVQASVEAIMRKHGYHD
jgi:uncharacterized protein